MRAPRAHSCRPEIVGISGREIDMKQQLLAPQFGIGEIRRPKNPKPAHKTVSIPVETPSTRKAKRPPVPKPAVVADLVAEGWSHSVISITKTHAVVEFTSPVGNLKEVRTILRGMLPDPGPRGRPVLRLGKTDRDHDSGAWKQHLDNRVAHAEVNRGHVPVHGSEGRSRHRAEKGGK